MSEMSNFPNDVDVVNGASEEDMEENNEVDDEVNKFLEPYRKLISDSEENNEVDDEVNKFLEPYRKLISDSEENNEVDEEVNKFLEPYRKLISDSEELQSMRIKTSMRQHKEMLDKINALQNAADEIDRRSKERMKVIIDNADLIKCILEERNDTDCIAVGHEYQAQLISAVEGLVDFTNNFPQMMEIISQIPETDQTEIVPPHKDAVQ